MKELKLYYCEHCKKVVEVVVDTAVPLVCCGQKMTEVKANSTEAAHEKHLPVIEKDGDKVTVKVSTVEHPMLEEHYITAIWLKKLLFLEKNQRLYLPYLRTTKYWRLMNTATYTVFGKQRLKTHSF